MLKGLSGFPNLLFNHSNEFDQGGGKIRRGSATAVVALDGSGDFATIQEGLDALPKEGGVVFIKEGIYTIKNKLTIPKDNVAIVGTGKGTIIDAAVSGESAISATGLTGLLLSDLSLNGANGTDVAGISFTNCNENFIRNLWIENMGSGESGIFLSNCEKISILGCNIEANVSSRGIDLTGTTIQCIISNCFIHDNLTGIRLGDGSVEEENIITNNIIEDNTTGVEVGSSAVNTLIHGNQFVSNTSEISDSGTTTLIKDNIPDSLNGGGTSYWSIPGSAFLPDSPDTTPFDLDNGELEMGGTPDNETIYAPVFLPHGAVVTAAVVNGNNTRTWQLIRRPLDGTTENILATAAVDTEDSSISNATIDNQTYVYYIRITFTQSGDDFHGARITYTN